MKDKQKLVKQSGGVLFATGDYGCLFKDPAPVCEETGKPIDAEVGKLIVESGSGQQDEINKTEILKKMPGFKDFLILPEKTCRASHVQPDPDWSKCFLTLKDTKLLILGMADGGETLKDSLQRTPWFCKNFITLLEHLVEGVVLMHRNGWAHTDIHDKNILIDKNDIPRYIDFGLALNKSNPNKEELDTFSEYNVSLIFMPPEYHVYAMNLNKIDFRTGILHIGSQSIYERIQNLLGSKQNIDDVLKKLINNPKVKTDAVTFYTTYSEKTDIWSLGMVFYRAFMHCLSFPDAHLISEFNIERIKTILKLMLAFDPDTRGSAEQVLSLINPSNHFLVRRIVSKNKTVSQRANLRENVLVATTFLAKPLVLENVFLPPPFSSKMRTRRGTQKKSQKRV
jgi:serine/threonine protein kinase